MGKEERNQEEKNMQALAKEQVNKGLSLSSKKLKEITIRPKVKDGKLLFDKNNKDHRYIVEEGEY
ncbi:MAG: hypothetical protein P4L59_20570 [Desulfosporosinus sp.]|nr:hypothetical protein [Desulfosporosinus sp.]